MADSLFGGLGNIFKSKDEITNDRYNALTANASTNSNYANDLAKLNTETAAAYAPNTTTLGLDNSTWSGLGSLGTLGAAGLNAWTGMKQLDLAEDTFNFNKLDANRTYEMAKDAYDKNVARAGSIGTQMNAGKVG